jgi:hypothetical protein
MKYLISSLFVFEIGISIHVYAQKTTSLFNQKDLKGWYAYEAETGKHLNASDLFSVENGMIRMYGKKPGYLMLERSYQKFQLTVEFRWNMDTSFARKSTTKNSGVMYLVPSDTPDMLWPKGIQFQIKEGATGDFVLLQEVTLVIQGQRTEPGKSVVSKHFLDASLPDGEWNTLVVTVEKGKVKQELNGKLVNEGTEASLTEGRILLQYEGYPIDFRKVDIKELP